MQRRRCGYWCLCCLCNVLTLPGLVLQPDLAILAVNTFVKDAQDSNPLIRALAVRTMGCIRVDKITGAHVSTMVIRGVR